MKFFKVLFIFLLFPDITVGKELLVVEKVKKYNSSIIHRHYVRHGDEPLSLHLFEIDNEKIKLKFNLALDKINGRETVSSMVMRKGSLGGINGGYFETIGSYQGDPQGFYLLDGKILSEPIYKRSSVGICNTKKGQILITDQFTVDAFLQIGSKEEKISGINRARGVNDLILYTPNFGSNTLTNDSGSEFVFVNGKLRIISVDKGANAIPKNGFVVSASVKIATKLNRKMRKTGMPASLEYKITSIRKPKEKIDVENCSFTTAGPTLILDGKILPKYKKVYHNERHPRSAIGVNLDGKIIMVVVDGRHPEHSVGMSLSELANFLKSENVIQGYNLDGGGSSTLVFKDKVINNPSDITGERAVGDSILFFKK
jgi:exopolysaccharide biosynthesis protein